jgi:hypothetical protein
MAKKLTKMQERNYARLTRWADRTTIGTVLDDSLPETSTPVAKAFFKKLDAVERSYVNKGLTLGEMMQGYLCNAVSVYDLTFPFKPRKRS